MQDIIGYNKASSRSPYFRKAIKYTLIASLPLLVVTILSSDGSAWVLSDVHHFYFEIIAVLLDAILAFYCLSRAVTLNDKFYLFLGMAFAASALIDLLHGLVSIGSIGEGTFLGYFIPQTWAAGRIMDGAMIFLALTKYAGSREATARHIRNAKSLITSASTVVVISAIVIMFSLYSPLPNVVIDSPLHRPYDALAAAFFVTALVFFYLRALPHMNEVFFKGILLYLVVSLFAEVIIAQSAMNFDTQFNVAHILKDVAYLILVIALSRSAIQYSKKLGKLTESLEKTNEGHRQRERDSLLTNQMLLAQHTKQRQLSKELKAAREKYRMLYEGSPDLCRTIDTNGIIINCNEKYATSLGYPINEVIGASVFDHVAEESQDAMRNSFEAWKRTGHVENREVWFRRKDGSLFPGLISATNTYDDKGKVVGSNTTIRDTSEIHMLKAVDRAKEEFSAMITHELKTPLFPIMGYTELLLHESAGPLTQKQTKQVKQIYESAKSLQRLIQDVLDVHKLELGNLDLSVCETPINGLVDRSIQRFKPLADTKDIKLRGETEQELKVKCDPERTLQVLNNLVGNALKFVPDHGGRIEVYVRRENGSALFSIWDNGIGISKANQQNLFKKFYQVDMSSKRKTGGSGLGLAICKGIVEAHNGKIWVDSREGKGSTFYFSIPIDGQN